MPPDHGVTPLEKLQQDTLRHGNGMEGNYYDPAQQLLTELAFSKEQNPGERFARDFDPMLHEAVARPVQEAQLDKEPIA